MGKKQTKQELEDRISELEGTVDYLETHASDRDHWVRSFEAEKREHGETWQKVHSLKYENYALEQEVKAAKKTIASLMVQNVRLQGRLEGVLLTNGHLKIKGGE